MRKLMYCLLVAALALPSRSALHAQGVPAVASPAVPALTHGAAAWGDCDGDGRPDLLVCGRDSLGVSRTFLLHNMGTALPVDLTQNLAQVSMGDAAWGDYDADGDPDLVLTGETSPRHSVTLLYQNNGGLLSLVPTPALPGLTTGRALWRDMDADGDLDMFLTGYNEMEGYLGIIARNDGGGNFVPITDAAYATREWSSVAVGDYDQDGRPDIAFADTSPLLSEGNRTVVLHNDGGLRFSPVAHLIPGFYAGSLDFGDADGDGDLDLLCAGTGTKPVTAVFPYNSGQFQSVPTALTALGHGEARFVDFNGDGALDIVSCGRTATTFRAIAYKRAGTAYLPVTGPVNEPGLYHSRLAIADWNGDGFPDFVVMGQGADDMPASNVGTWNATTQTFEY